MLRHPYDVVWSKYKFLPAAANVPISILRLEDFYFGYEQDSTKRQGRQDQ